MRRVFAALFLLGWLLPTPALADATPHTWLFVIGGIGTSVGQSTADFGPLFQALKTVAPAGDWTMADLSYNGDGIDSAGNPTPVPYSPCDTTRDIWASVGMMAGSLVTFQTAHPNDRIVLVGHSLGGFLAYYMAQAAPSLRIAANVSIDAPLHGASGWDWTANPPGCQAGPAFNELYKIGQADAADTASSLSDAYYAGVTPRNVGIVANDADCLYDLGLLSCPLAGSDWRYTMYGQADWTATYTDVVSSGTSWRSWITSAHGAILQDSSAMRAIIRFLARS